MTAKVFHAQLWGLREQKYHWLSEHDITTTEWNTLTPKSEFYLLIPRDEKLLLEYEKNIKITNIFSVYGVGMTTARDGFVIDYDIQKLLNRIHLFKNSRLTDEELYKFSQINKKKGWNIRKAWKMLQNISDQEIKKYILPVLYRPFDIRWIFYHDSVVWRTVKRLMLHMINENLGIITPKQFKEQPRAFITNNIIGHYCPVRNRINTTG